MSTTSSPNQRPYYNEDIDFTALATQDAEFSKLLDSNGGRIDWQDPLAVQYTTLFTSPTCKQKVQH